MFKAIVFDMDGVLITSTLSVFSLERMALSELGITLPASEHMRLSGLSRSDFLTYIKKHYALRHSVEDLKEAFLNVQKRYHRSSTFPLIEGVKSFLHRVNQHYILTIASSASRRSIENVLVTHDLSHFFTVYTSVEEVGHGKPHPAVYLHAAEKLSVKPQDCLVIEDSEAGATGAKAAGMICLGFSAYGFPPSPRLPDIADHVISSYEEATDKLLQKLWEKMKT